MSQPMPPYAAAPRPTKPRPSAWWFVLGGGLIVAAVAVGVALFAWALSGFLSTDGTVPADGQAHSITVGTDGDRMLWGSAARQDCVVVDRAGDTPVQLRPVHGSFTRSDSRGSFVGFYRFSPGSGRLSVTCTPDEADGVGEVLIGPMPQVGSFVVGIIAGILVPLVLGLAGLALLIVTGVLFATRPPRPTRVKA